MSNNTETDFRLSGGGLARFFYQRAHVTGKSVFPPPAQLLIAIGLLWLPLVLMTMIAGTFSGDGIAHPFITDVVPQVRFLIALPVLVLAGLTIDPAVDDTIWNLGTSGVVPESESPRFQAALASLARWRDSIWPDIVLLILAFALTWIFRPGYAEAVFEASDSSWLQSTTNDKPGPSVAGWWYLLVSTPLFQFILFRWFWRFLIWAGFLYRLSRIRFALQPTHPDLAGGIGMLGLCQQTFVIVFVAFGTIMAATVANDMLLGGSGLEGARLEMLAFVLICLVAVYAPLAFFTNQLYVIRRRGLAQHGALGYRLSATFHTQWMSRADKNIGTELDESPDPSAMADYGAVFDTVRSMRFIPASLRNMTTTAAVLAAPFLPLLLIQFSVVDLINRAAHALF